MLGNQNAYTDPVRVSGVGVTRDYNINISGTWSGTLTFQRSFDAFDAGFTDARFQVPGPPVSIAGPNIISPFSGFLAHRRHPGRARSRQRHLLGAGGLQVRQLYQRNCHGLDRLQR